MFGFELEFLKALEGIRNEILNKVFELCEEDCGLIVGIVVVVDDLDPIIANLIRYIIKYSNSADEIVIAEV